MAYERMNLPVEYHKPNELKVGEAYEGIYQGQGEDTFKNPTYKFKNPEEGKLHVFNHCGAMAKEIREFVTEGDWCRFTYAGAVKMTGGKFKGSACHTFDLDIDPDRSVRVAPTTPTEETEPTTSASDDDLGTL